MKRIATIVLCFAVLMTLCFSVSATGSAYMSLSCSANTVYRGDTFTITVSLSNDQPVSNGGIRLINFSDRFEIIGGSCSVSGATLEEVSADRAGGVFMLKDDAIVSGTIFTIKLRVKSDATIGTAKISGIPSLNIGCGGTNTISITVACNHEYGTPVAAGDAEHTSTCPHCGDVKTESHTFADKTIHQEANCKEPGSKTVECTVCHHTLEQTIPVNEKHDWGACISLGLSGHTHTCNRCQKKEDVDHRWNNGTTTKQASCTETGLLKRTCVDCGGTRDDLVPKAAHSYTPFQKVDDNTHTHSCTVCQNVETLAHDFGDTWLHDPAGHYQQCAGCNFTQTLAQHVPGPEATDNTPQLCTVCNRMLKPSLNHAHVFSSEWTSDATAHWHSCESCTQAEGWEKHVYSDDCDENCNVCGWKRTAPHVTNDTWIGSEDGHWKTCLNCKKPTGVEPHVPGAAATVTEPQRCSVCSYIIAPVLEHDPVYDNGTTRHWHTCICGEELEVDAENCQICKDQGQKKVFPWWLICVAEAAVLGIVILILALKMRKLQLERRSSRW